MKPAPLKVKAAPDSAAREEYADAPSIVAELVAQDAYRPGRLVRRGLWQNLGHWTARALLFGGGSMLLIGLTGPFGVTVAAGLILPFAGVLAMGSHLDQFRGDRTLRLGDQMARWWLTAAELWPVSFVYLLMAAAFGILANMNRIDWAAQAVALGGVAFLALAWTESLAHRILRHGETPDAVGAGIQRAGRRITRSPMHVLQSFSFSRTPPGESWLLSSWMSGIVNTALMAILAGALALALGPDGHRLNATIFLAFLAAGVVGWQTFEMCVGIWVHHYLAYLAEERGLLAEARRALAAEQT